MSWFLLVLIASPFNTFSPTLTTVTGFKSEQQCNESGRWIMQAFMKNQSLVSYSYTCVENQK